MMKRKEHATQKKQEKINENEKEVSSTSAQCCRQAICRRWTGSHPMYLVNMWSSTISNSLRSHVNTIIIYLKNKPKQESRAS